MTDSPLHTTQDREHQLALDLAQSLVRIDALKFELARASEKNSTLESERDSISFILANAQSHNLDLRTQIHKLRKVMEKVRDLAAILTCTKCGKETAVTSLESVVCSFCGTVYGGIEETQSTPGRTFDLSNRDE
jgi:hypothetical protein